MREGAALNIEDYPLSLTVKQVAKIMGVCVPKAYDIVRRPDFPKLKDGNRILIARDAFWCWYNGPAMQSQTPVA